MLSKSTIKYIQSLQHKKFRDEHKAFIAEGPKVVGELLASGSFRCRKIFATEEWIDQATPALHEEYDNLIFPVEHFELEKIANLSTPNQVVAEFEKKEFAITDYRNRITFVLDDIQDPGNLGTIIRTADWFGIPQILCSENTVDLYNNKVVQSTMASLGRVAVAYANLAELLLKKPVPCFAATTEGKNVSEVRALKEGMIVIGNESKGISKQILSLADEQISIPRAGLAESLNAAVAASIIAYVIAG